jgi:hypothetical protein
MEGDMERDYVAVSIKHTGFKVGKPVVLWGYHTTRDDEKRCFGGYTVYPNKAERYALGEFEERGYPADCVKPEPVPFTLDMFKKYKSFDTVLVKYEEIKRYYINNYLALNSPEEDYE